MLSTYPSSAGGPCRLGGSENSSLGAVSVVADRRARARLRARDRDDSARPSTGRLDGYALPNARIALDTSVAITASIVAILAAMRFLVEGRGMDLLLAAGFFATGLGTFAFAVAPVLSGRRARLRRVVGCGRREPVRGGADRGRPVRHAPDRKASAPRGHGRPRAVSLLGIWSDVGLPRTRSRCLRTRRSSLADRSSSPTACSPFCPSSRWSASGCDSVATAGISTAGSR